MKLLLALVFSLNKREIYISETTSHDEEMVEAMAFELNNLKRKHEISLITPNSCNFTANEFAYAMEAIEYESFKDTMEISKNCVEGRFWIKSLPQFLKERKWTSFDKFLEAAEESGHADIYRIHWYEQCYPKSLEGCLQEIWINIRRLTNALLG